MKGYFARIEECNRYELAHFLPFLVGERRVGFVRPVFAEALRECGEVFRVDDGAVRLDPALDTPENRTQALADAVGWLHRKGVIKGWYGERFAISEDLHAPVVFEIERAAVTHFGLRARGVHVNGLVQTASGVEMWIARRASNRQNFPGMLDHLAAGGQPAGLSLKANVVKECAEEAGVPESLAEQAVYVGELTYCCETAKGLKPDTLHAFDLWLPEEFVPRIVDGEVETFERWPIQEVARAVAGSRVFKPNCNLVIIDCLLRHGLVTGSATELAQLRAALHPPLP